MTKRATTKRPETQRLPEVDAYAREWNRWQDVLDLLVESGACDLHDLAAPIGSEATPGQRLLTMLRRWGTELVTLNSEVNVRLNALRPKSSPR